MNLMRGIRAFLLMSTMSAISAAMTLAHAGDPAKQEIRFGATAGPYADQIRYGIKPVLEKEGYKVSIVEFTDYVQPNLALADGALDANAFQHEIYLKKFSDEHNLKLSELIKVPTAPIGAYSHRFKSLADLKDGATVSLPNDVTNQARAIVLLEQIGWVTLKPGTNPVTSSERDIATNPHKLKLLPLDAAQLPRSLDDVDYAFINGNFALAAGLKLTDSLLLEKIPPHYLNLVAVRSADIDKPYVQDIANAYKSPEFRRVVDERFKGFTRPDYLR